MTSSNSWAQRNVLITGINGFIGGNLARRLIADGATVTGIERNQNRQSMLYHEGLDKHAQIVNGDLCDMAFLERVIAEDNSTPVFILPPKSKLALVLQALTRLSRRIFAALTHCLMPSAKWVRASKR